MWGSFDRSDIETGSAGWDGLVKAIRDKTGESVEVVEAKLDHVLLDVIGNVVASPPSIRSDVR